MDLMIVAVFAIAVLFALAAQVWGVDSRSSFIDPRVTDTWSA